MKNSFFSSRSAHLGYTLPELLLAVFVLVTVVLGVVGLAVLNTRTAIQSERRTVALGIANEQVEYIRTLPYQWVGFTNPQGEEPDGVLEQESNVTRNDQPYTVHLAIELVDDPVNGTVSGTLNEINADYKKVRVVVSWQDVTGQTQETPVVVTYVAEGALPQRCVPGDICPDGQICPSNSVCPPPPTCTPGVDVCPDGSVCPSSSICPVPTPPGGCVPGSICPDGQICPASGICPPPINLNCSSDPFAECDEDDDCGGTVCDLDTCECIENRDCEDPGNANICAEGFCCDPGRHNGECRPTDEPPYEGGDGVCTNCLTSEHCNPCYRCDSQFRDCLLGCFNRDEDFCEDFNPWDGQSDNPNYVCNGGYTPYPLPPIIIWGNICVEGCCEADETWKVCRDTNGDGQVNQDDTKECVEPGTKCAS